MLLDPFGRRIDYLRLSVTDRCNLRCVYCMPPGGIVLRPAGEILSYEELLRVARVGAALGIRKVRVTGGEPLVRGGIVDFVARLARIEGIADLSLTTNGVGLKEAARPLRDAGLSRVNVSLDTIRRDRYAEITRRDALPLVLEGIEAAVRAGLSPVKINVVLLHGLLAAEVDEFFAMAAARPVEVRFIERMPVGCLPAGGYVSAEEIRRRILALPRVRERREDPSSTAVIYEVPGWEGRLGLVLPLSRRFCSSCNRLRVTADGRLRPCLFSSSALDLRAVLRGGGSDEDLAGMIRRAAGAKPEGHGWRGPGSEAAVAEPMWRLGG